MILISTKFVIKNRAKYIFTFRRRCSIITDEVGGMPVFFSIDISPLKAQQPLFCSETQSHEFNSYRRSFAVLFLFFCVFAVIYSYYFRIMQNIILFQM